jgi:hypothetical protein
MPGHTGVSVLLRVPVQPLTSIAVIVNVWLVVLVGVPVTAPVDVFRLKPDGSVPLLTL